MNIIDKIKDTTTAVGGEDTDRVNTEETAAQSEVNQIVEQGQGGVSEAAATQQPCRFRIDLIQSFDEMELERMQFKEPLKVEDQNNRYQQHQLISKRVRIAADEPTNSSGDQKQDNCQALALDLIRKESEEKKKITTTVEGDGTSYNITASIRLNNAKINYEKPFQVGSFTKEISKTICTLRLTSISIVGVKTGSLGLGILLDTIVKLIDQNNGLNELILGEFPASEQFSLNLDQNILNQLISKTSNLKKLYVRSMSKVYWPARTSLIDMTGKILAQSASQLTHLSLDGLSDESTDGAKVLIAMCRCKFPQLRFLDLQRNKFWWIEEGTENNLIKFLGKVQYTLKYFFIGQSNQLSSGMTLKLMQKIRNSPMVDKLESLHLDNCIWDSRDNCAELCHIIATSTSISDIYIKEPRGNRKIKFEKIAQGSEGVGLVRAIDMITQTNVYSEPCSNTKFQEIHQQ